MKRLFALTLFLATVCAVILCSPQVHASSLRIQPLDYKFSLKKDEKKRGFVDITNTSPGDIAIKLSVQGFRQVDDKGSLKFYDDDIAAKGISFDVHKTSLRPSEALRLFFIADGSKLPVGDVFIALFATEQSKEVAPTAQAIRIGTLLSIENQRPGSRVAAIQELNLNFFQFGSGLSGSYRIKNTADVSERTAFYPESMLKISPFIRSHKLSSSLVFAGRSRTNKISVEVPRFGLYNVSLAYEGSVMTKKVFMVTGFYRPLTIILSIVLLVGLSLFLLRKHLSL